MSKPKESYTVKELSELFGITKQSIRQRLEKIPNEFKVKNTNGHLALTENGVRQLEQAIGRYVLSDETNYSEENIGKSREIELLEHLLLEQSETIKDLRQKLDQEQQLTAMALQQTSQLQLEYQEVKSELIKEKNRTWFSKLFKR